MSTLVETPRETERAERPVLRRTFEVPMEVSGDGRTIDARIVPYGEVATVDDGRGPYQEEWTAGAFDGQLDHAHRVYLNFQHQQGIAGVVGRGITLREEADGLHGSFRVFDHPDGDKALLLVNEGVLGGVSLEFLAKKSIRTAEGVVRRVKAHLDAVALCRVGAFVGAQVLAVREEIHDEITLEADLLPLEMDSGLVERLRAQGIALPDRYQAHPVETDTPAETGTSEDGTRPTEETTSLED